MKKIHSSLRLPSLIPENGYGSVINYLYEQCLNSGCEFHFDSTVKEVLLHANEVTVSTSVNSIYHGKMVVVTVPLGILTGNGSLPSHITFIPEIPEKIIAAQKIGYGKVIKVVLEFMQRFWDDKTMSEQVPQVENMNLLFGDKPVSVWWSHDTSGPAIITGWCGGPACDNLYEKEESEILSSILSSLSKTLNIETSFLEKQLVKSKVLNWAADPFSSGAYSYQTVETAEAKEILSKPVDNRIYFAGEGVCNGDSMGTVEAAIESGNQVAEKIKNVMRSA